MFLKNSSGKKETSSFGSKDTLIIIGNGFDLWQGLPTGYDNFRKFYLLHRDEIMKNLRIKEKIAQESDGHKMTVSDVELIYGDPFEPGQLADDFWSTFEASLDKLDAERLNLFFGKDRKGLRNMQKSIRNADRILREAFCRWIAAITVDHIDAGYRFGDNCLFLNFNYTDTLEKRFKVKKEHEYHIHGEASDPSSIIYGHSSHPQLPERILYQLGGRFRGLYFADRILYETDKHVQDNIQCLCMFFAQHGVMAEEIKNVYVVGHSMGLPDMEYFAFLADATRIHKSETSDCKIPDLEAADFEEPDKEPYPMDQLYNRLQYIINHVGYRLDDEFNGEGEAEAVSRKYAQEQAERNQVFQKMFMKSLGKVTGKEIQHTNTGTSPRTQDAVWHISYFSNRDRQWAETFMKELGCSRVYLYPTIDECLKSFQSP